MPHSASSALPHLPASAGARRTRCRPRPIDPRSPRPSELPRAFFAAGLMAIVAAAAVGVAFTVTGRGWLHWLALHLLFLGGVSQLVLGAGQFFTCAFLATDPPPRTLVAGQLAVWNAGTILVAVGVPTGSTALVEAGAALIGAGLVLFAWALAWMKRRSVQRAPSSRANARDRPAVFGAAPSPRSSSQIDAPPQALNVDITRRSRMRWNASSISRLSMAPHPAFTPGRLGDSLRGQAPVAPPPRPGPLCARLYCTRVMRHSSRNTFANADAESYPAIRATCATK